jgi:hypothetical protein
MKTVGGLRRTRYRGLDCTQLRAYLVAPAYNLLRIGRLTRPPYEARIHHTDALAMVRENRHARQLSRPPSLP